MDVPAVDYLRLGSFNKDVISGFHRLVRRRSDVEENAGWKQYRGIRSGQVFAGVAEQGVKIHGLLDVSGTEAQSVVSAELRVGLDVKCTRIDLQVTVPLLNEYRYRARVFKDALEMSDWVIGEGQRIHKRRVDLWEGPQEDGLDTVYIGSRKSDRFARVYVKEDSNEALYLRFEAEFKGELAAAVYGKCIEDGRMVAAILRGEWERIPPVDAEAWQQIGKVLAQYIDGNMVSVPRSAGDMNSKYRWFVDTVVPALVQLSADHDYGWRVRDVLRDLVEVE